MKGDCDLLETAEINAIKKFKSESSIQESKNCYIDTDIEQSYMDLLGYLTCQMHAKDYLVVVVSSLTIIVNQCYQ